MNGLCTIQTGDKVGQQWSGPYWTPYAQAIADYYPNQVPWFLTARADLGAAAAGVPSRLTVLTSPYLYDVLIFGAMITGTATQVPFIGIQVTHDQSGIPWAAPNVLPFIPLTAFGGLNVNATSLFRWPDAFFFPKHTRLKLDFSLIDTVIGNPDLVTVTFVGVQLIGSEAPKWITMPNGSKIRADSRLPLFMTMGLGQRSGQVFTLDVTQHRIQYLPPIGCDVEIHDLSSNLISAAFPISEGVALTPGASSAVIKETVMGIEGGWTPNQTPVPAVFGGPGGSPDGSLTQVYPALPYTKPFLLPKGHRIQLDMQNNSIAGAFTNGYLTFRGVRLCEYS
jgi:hypothetical protein